MYVAKQKGQRSPLLLGDHVPIIRGALYYNIVFVLLQLVSKNMFIPVKLDNIED